MGRYYGSEALRNLAFQKKAFDYALDKINPPSQNFGSQALNQLLTKMRPKTLMVVLEKFKKIYQSLENFI